MSDDCIVTDVEISSTETEFSVPDCSLTSSEQSTQQSSSYDSLLISTTETSSTTTIDSSPVPLTESTLTTEESSNTLSSNIAVTTETDTVTESESSPQEEQSDYSSTFYIDESPNDFIVKHDETPSVSEEEPEKCRLPRPNVLVDTSHAKTSKLVLKKCMEELGWKELKNNYPYFIPKNSKSADIYWHGVTFEDSPNAGKFSSVKVNKFPGMVKIARKQHLTHVIRRMRDLFSKDFDFYPRTWLLPEEYSLLIAHYTIERQRYPRKRQWFIGKPDEGSQGTGIYLTNDPTTITIQNSTRNFVMQDYIPNPLLIDGYKFDFRVYVLVRSISPLEIYVSSDGLARLCTIPYEKPTPKNCNQMYMHLTNYSLNKYSDTYEHTDSLSRGSKRAFTTVISHLSAEGYNVNKLNYRIRQVCVLTVLAMLPDIRIAMQTSVADVNKGPSCFQILGLDILLSSECTPHLLEVNANPSLNIEHEQQGLNPNEWELVYSAVDDSIKRPIVMESLLLSCPPQQLIPTINYLNAYDVKCAVQYPEVLFFNNDDIRKPTLRLVSVGLNSKFVREELFIIDRIALLYNKFLTPKNNRFGIYSFRLFTRKCSLLCHGFNSAAVDLMFIQVCKKWGSTVDSVSVMCFNAFLDAFGQLAHLRCKHGSKLDKILELTDHCYDAVGLTYKFDVEPSLPQDIIRQMRTPC